MKIYYQQVNLFSLHINVFDVKEQARRSKVTYIALSHKVVVEYIYQQDSVSLNETS
jgi:hypothetical protein